MEISENKVFKEFAKYTGFSVISSLGLSLYILADSFFVANAVGIDGLAALNVALPIFNFMNAIAMMLGVGGASRFSIKKVQGLVDEGKKIYSTTIVLGLLSSLFFVILGFFSMEISKVLGARADTLTLTSTYIRMVFLLSPISIMSNIIVTFARNDEATRLATVGMVVGTCSNIALDYILMYPMGLGMFGAAFATAISPGITLVIVSTHMLSPKNNLKLTKTKLSMERIRRIFSTGAHSFINQICLGLLLSLFNILIGGIGGTSVLAAYGVITNIADIIRCMFDGVANGAQPLFSRYYALKEGKSLENTVKWSVILGVIIAAVAYLVTFIWGKEITSLFNSESDYQMQKTAIIGLRLYFIGSPLAVINIVFSMYFSATSTPRPAKIISLLRGMVVAMPMAIMLSKSFGVAGVLSSYPITEAIVVLYSFFTYKYNILKYKQMTA